MTTPTNFGGLSSGVQWNDIVDATVNAMKARTVTPITDRITLRDKQKAAWTTLQGLVDTFNRATFKIRNSGFGGMTATVPTSLTTGRSLFTATAGTNADTGRYRVEVLQTADTAKLAGGSVADTTAARNLSGSFTVNGTAIAVDAADSLAGIRDKINQANAGVTATIVSEGGTAGRLVLTSTTSGSAGIQLTDGAEGLGRELGFLDSRTKPVSSATVAAAAAMGLAVFPQPASIRVGNITITADLATESLANIAAKINAAGGSASVQSESFGGETRYRLVTDGVVSADPGDPGSQDVIDALGFAAGTYGLVPQAVQSSVFTDGVNGPANAATSLTALAVDGVSPGLAVGDAINIRGTRGDGTAVTYGLVVQPGDTVQTLLDRINDTTNGFGAGAQTATAALTADGRIRLTDDTGGASRLSLSLTITRADGTTGSLGPTTTAVAGRSRELQQGRDAIVRVDGEQFVRSTNVLADVITGVTLNLQQAEVGTQLDLDVARDQTSAVAAAKGLVDGYNAIVSFIDEQRKIDSPLYGNSSLRNTMRSITAALQTEVAANGTYTRSVKAGMALDRDGKLTLDETVFRKALDEKPRELEALFGRTGVGGALVTATDNAMRFGIGPISSNINSIIKDVAKLKGKEAEANRVLEDRRMQLILQFTRMEEAMSRLQAQGSSLLSSMQALQPQQR